MTTGALSASKSLIKNLDSLLKTLVQYTACARLLGEVSLNVHLVTNEALLKMRK